MPLWGNVDNAANSDIAVLAQVNKSISPFNRGVLYGNNTANDYFTGVTVGQFGVSTAEQAATAPGTAKAPHAGWNLRTVGSGGRAGRVQYETLVAMGSLSGDGSDDSVLPDSRIVISIQPASNTMPKVNAISLSVTAATLPAGSLIAYQWQQSYAGVPAWTAVPASAPYSGGTTSTLAIANNQIASGNTFRAVLTVSGGATVYTSNATVTAT